MPKVTRTFIAVELPEPTGLAVERLQESLCGEAPGLRMTAPGLLHLTLAFLGDVPTARLDRLCDAVSEAVARLPRFDLSLEGLGAFPSPTRPRVVWVGVVGEALPALSELHRAVTRATTRAGHPPADDRLHPHVTIARAKAGRGPSPDLAPACDRHRGNRAGPLPVDAVVTVASELTPGGPIHTPLRSSPLAGTSA